MTDDKTGRIVWHDLFTADRQGSMAFYQRVASWTYQIEHATDFAWGGGEKDFVLALSGEEAGAGFVETPPELRSGWVAYVEVRDVDETATRAQQLGGTVIRQPFDVPGVGRNALLRDPLGAFVGVSLSRHSFPVPQRQFGPEVYLSDAPTVLQTFYGPLFGWTSGSTRSEADAGDTFASRSGDGVAVHISGKPPNGERALWAPSLKVRNLERALHDAEELGGKPFVPPRPAKRLCSLLHDPEGASFCFQET